MSTTWIKPELYTPVHSGDTNPDTGDTFRSGDGLYSGMKIEYDPADTSWTDPD